MGDFEKFWQEILPSTDRTSSVHKSLVAQLSDLTLKSILEKVEYMLGGCWEKSYFRELYKKETEPSERIEFKMEKGLKIEPALYRIFLCNIGLLAKHGCKERLYYQFWRDAVQGHNNKFEIFDDLCNNFKTRKHIFFSNSFFYFVKYFALSISTDLIDKVLMQDRIENICHQMKSTELQNIFYYRMWDLFSDHKKVIAEEKDDELQKYKANYHFVSRVFNNDINGLNSLLMNHYDLLSMQDINKCFTDYLNNYYQCRVLSLGRNPEFHANDKTDCLIDALRHNFWTTMVENCSEEIIGKVIDYYFDQAKLRKSNQSNNAFKDILRKTDKYGENFIHKLIKYKKNEVVKHILNLGLFDDCDTSSYISYAALYKNYEIIPFIHAKHTESKANVNAARIMSERSQAEAWAKIV